MTLLIVKLFLLYICGMLWRMGGSDEFPLSFRRAGVPVVIAINSILMQNWIGLGSIPLMVMAIGIGYGVNSTLIKKFKSKYLVRFICGLAYVVSAIPILWGNWGALAFHLWIVPVGVMLAGTQKFKNQHAVTEEAFIGVLFSLVPIMG